MFDAHRREERGDHEVIPWPAGQDLIWVVDRVDGVALIECQQVCVAFLEDLDVVVFRFGFVDELAAIRWLDVVAA